MIVLGASMNWDLAAKTIGNEGALNVTMTQFAKDLTSVRQARLLFSHQSVGANILAGIRQLDAEFPGPALRTLPLEQAADSPGPVLIDYSGGRNADPKSKIDAFAATIRNEARLKIDVAFMKFCYVDFNPRTNVEDLFGHYRSTLEVLKREHPQIQFVHVTVPLTTWPTGLKWRIFRIIGKEVWEDAANVKRAQFSRRLHETFKSDPVFDLALVEATTPEGRLTQFEQHGQSYLSLYPGYTEDNGHLNAAGQRAAANAIIKILAEATRVRGSAR